MEEKGMNVFDLDFEIWGLRWCLSTTATDILGSMFMFHSLGRQLQKLNKPQGIDRISEKCSK